MLTMLKYTTVNTNKDGSFSPSHRRDHIERLMRDSIEAQPKGRHGTKMSMKKRAKQIQKRSKETTLLPPIFQQHGELSTPYISNISLGNNDIEVPYIQNLSMNRLVDVATPYILDSQLSKMDAGSPFCGKDAKLIAVKNHTHDLKRERTHESLHRTAMSNNVLLDKRKQERRHRYHRKTDDEVSDSDQNMNLQLHSNPVGLHERCDKNKPKQFHRSRTDEQFSIRKKIEQYRKWHEEQYKDKLKKLKQEVDDTYDFEQRKITLIKESSSERTEPKESRSEIFISNTIEESDESIKEVDNFSSSEHTWKTWRHANESYAYSDVNKYIEENELMTPQKHTRIEQWIMEVEKELGLNVLLGRV